MQVLRIHPADRQELMCSDCRAARYCNEACQLSDFRARHKHECVNFVHLPIAIAFLSKPDLSDKFPRHPLFAHGHENGVGCWVTIEGRIDCSYVNRSIVPAQF